jgi:ribosomal protein S27AE
MIQTCPNCGAELQQAKYTQSSSLVWTVDKYELSEVEIFINCQNCGTYMANEDFGI